MSSIDVMAGSLAYTGAQEMGFSGEIPLTRGFRPPFIYGPGCLPVMPPGGIHYPRYAGSWLQVPSPIRPGHPLNSRLRVLETYVNNISPPIQPPSVSDSNEVRTYSDLVARFSNQNDCDEALPVANGSVVFDESQEVASEVILSNAGEAAPSERDTVNEGTATIDLIEDNARELVTNDPNNPDNSGITYVDESDIANYPTSVEVFYEAANGLPQSGLEIKDDELLSKMMTALGANQAAISDSVKSAIFNKVTSDRQREIIKAARSLYSKRTCTLLHWIDPKVPKARLKASVQLAWEELPEWQKQIYISQVLGKFGVDAVIPMINPQLTGINEIADPRPADESSGPSKEATEADKRAQKKRKYTRRTASEAKSKKQKYDDSPDRDEQVELSDGVNLSDLENVANLDVSDDYWKQEAFDSELFPDFNI